MAIYGAPGSKEQIMGEVVEAIIARNPDGMCPPEDLVSEARPEDSPIHNRYQWDDAIAGELHRVEMARSHLRFLRVIDARTEKKEEAPAFCCVTIGESHGYQPRSIALANPTTRDEVLAEAIGLVKGAMARVTALEATLPKPLAELKPIRRAIEKAAQKIAA